MKPVKWFSDNDVKIIPGVIVYFQKLENENESTLAISLLETAKLAIKH